VTADVRGPARLVSAMIRGSASRPACGHHRFYAAVLSPRPRAVVARARYLAMLVATTRLSCFTSHCPQNAFLRRGSESRPRRPSPRTMPSATTPPAIADLTSTGTSLCSAETRGRLRLRAGHPAHHQAAEEAHGWVRMCLILLVSSSRIWSVGLGPSRYGCRV
jgi:hypothetical protein